ncbi:hypothetical protein HU200_039948 [Digitaria exilis]|uniref:MATH domain-containing protein n=1 Tax=Digitaria exilis TaxID=1010633 RepID=A0A835BA56_9POAL|nr:hypothetical protein HU200_039948 [Digitaria exilis]
MLHPLPLGLLRGCQLGRHLLRHPLLHLLLLTRSNVIIHVGSYVVAHDSTPTHLGLRAPVAQRYIEVVGVVVTCTRFTVAGRSVEVTGSSATPACRCHCTVPHRHGSTTATTTPMIHDELLTVDLPSLSVLFIFDSFPFLKTSSPPTPHKMPASKTVWTPAQRHRRGIVKVVKSGVFSVGGHQWICGFYPDGLADRPDYVAAGLPLSCGLYTS